MKLGKLPHRVKPEGFSCAYKKWLLLGVKRRATEINIGHLLFSMLNHCLYETHLQRLKCLAIAEGRSHGCRSAP